MPMAAPMAAPMAVPMAPTMTFELNMHSSRFYHSLKFNYRIIPDSHTCQSGIAKLRNIRKRGTQTFSDTISCARCHNYH